MADEAVQRQIHSEIKALCESVETQKIRFRGWDVVEGLPRRLQTSAKKLHIRRDKVICALLMKAINTHRSVLVLCDAGCADDAYGLCRVIFENAIALAWLLSGDWIARTDIYCLYMNAVKRRIKDIVDEHYGPGNPLVALTTGGVRPNERVIARKMFNDGWTNWARRLKPDSKDEYEQVGMEEMCVELTKDESVGLKTGIKRSMAYDGLYFDLCSYVHSTIPCLMNLMQDLGECYAIQPTARYEKVPTALLVANMSMLLALNASDNRLGLGIESAIEDIWSRMRSVEDEDKDETPT